MHTAVQAAVQSLLVMLTAALAVVSLGWQRKGQQYEELDARKSGSGLALRPVAAVQPPDAARLPRGMPNPVWPSDHISMVLDMEICGATP